MNPARPVIIKFKSHIHFIYMIQNNKLFFSEFWDLNFLSKFKKKNEPYIKMKPLTIDSFKPDKIKAVSSDQKSVNDFTCTSIKFEYDGDKIPPLRIDGSFRIFKFKNSKGPIYSLSINCDESLKKFFNDLREVIANETCRLVPKFNGKRLNPDSLSLLNWVNMDKMFTQRFILELLEKPNAKFQD